MAKESIAFRLDSALVEQLDARAAAQGHANRTDLLTNMVQAYLQDANPYADALQDAESNEALAQLQARLMAWRDYAEQCANWGASLVRKCRASGALAPIISMENFPSPPEEWNT